MEDWVEERGVVFYHEVAHPIIVDVEVDDMKHLVKLLRLDHMTTKLLINPS